MYKTLICFVLILLLTACSSKDMAMQIMADIQNNPPIKTTTRKPNGDVTTTYYDTSGIKVKLVDALMRDETLEWAKVVMPITASLGGTWISNYYSTKQNKDMWKGISTIAGDRYEMSGSQVYQLDDSSFDNSIEFPEVELESEQ